MAPPGSGPAGPRRVGGTTRERAGPLTQRGERAGGNRDLFVVISTSAAALIGLLLSPCPFRRAGRDRALRSSANSGSDRSGR